MHYADVKNGLLELAKECQVLWEENKDTQARFVNYLAELQRYQMAIGQLENEGKHDQAQNFRSTMMENQKRASTLYEQLTERRMTLVCVLKHSLTQNTKTRHF